MKLVEPQIPVSELVILTSWFDFGQIHHLDGFGCILFVSDFVCIFVPLFVCLFVCYLVFVCLFVCAFFG